MKNYIVIFLSLLVIPCAAQESNTLQIDLNTVYNKPDRGFLILYLISSMAVKQQNKIIFPDLTEISDTVFGQIYFTGNNHSAVANKVTVLVGNHSTNSPLIWVDYNNNLDFSEDIKPLLFSEEFIDITIPNIDKPQLVHTIRFHKPDSLKKSETRKMIEKYITKGEPFTDYYFDQRLNIRVGDFVFKQDSLRIGLIDWNINGAYNDLRKDRILFGEYGGEINGIEESNGAIIIDSLTYFQGISNDFEVTEISENGTTISIRPTSECKTKERITLGDTVPDYTFKLLSGKETSIYNQMIEQKYLYLNFWANWCAGCHLEVDDLKRIHSDYSDKITIVSLNFNENTDRINSFLDKYDIKWQNGSSTEEINNELFIYAMPRNILIDSSGKIMEMNIHPSVLLKRIDEF